MNRLLVACAALALCAPGTANADYWGSEIFFAYDYFEANGDGSSALITGGSALFQFGDSWNVKANADVGTILDEDFTFGQADVDLFFATPNFAAGGYVGVGNHTGTSSPFWYAGVEAAGFFGNFQTTGWVGYVSEEDEGVAYVEGGADLTFYVTPNTGVGAFLYFEHFETDYDFYGGGVFVEHRFAGTPFELFADIDAFRGDPGNDEFFGATLGVKVNFDPPGTSLQEHNRMMPF